MNSYLIMIIVFLLGLILGAIGAGRYISKNYVWRNKKEAEAYVSMAELFNQWLIFRHDGNGIDKYLIEKGYKKVVIYGMSPIGERLYDELQDTGVEIVSGIDTDGAGFPESYKICDTLENVADIDVIIVTDIENKDKLCEELSRQHDANVIAIDNILYCV